MQVPGLVLNSNLYSALVHLGQVLDAECEARLGEHVEELSGLKVVDSIVHGRRGQGRRVEVKGWGVRVGVKDWVKGVVEIQAAVRSKVHGIRVMCVCM